MFKVRCVRSNENFDVKDGLVYTVYDIHNEGIYPSFFIFTNDMGWHFVNATYFVPAKD